MLREINTLGQTAKTRTEQAIALIANPQSVAAPLMAHFRVRPDDTARINIIRRHLEAMRADMNGNDIRFWCRDEGDPTCRRRRAAAYNCQSSSPRYVLICGSYAFSAADPETRFISGSDWVRTLIHEYVHLSCRSPGEIFAHEEEVYHGREGYPPEPDRAVKNADSYAHFVMQAQEGSAGSGSALGAILGGLLGGGAGAAAGVGIGLAAGLSGGVLAGLMLGLGVLGLIGGAIAGHFIGSALSQDNSTPSPTTGG